MKKINFYILLSTLLFSFSANAQKLALGLRGGVSIPNLTTGGGSQVNPLNEGYKSRSGADFGLYAEYKFSKMFSLQPMVEYSQQGGKKDGLQAFPTPGALAAMYPPGYAPTYMYGRFNSTAKLNYLMIPVLAKFGWNLGKESPFRIYVSAGPFVSFLVAAHQVNSGQSLIYSDESGQQPISPYEQSFDSNLDIKKNLHTANFGAEGNLGISYNVKRSTIFIEGGFNYGFVNIQKEAYSGKNETGAATACIGYAYWFGK